MTVVCGRAGFGAGSVLRAMICGAFAVLGLVTGGCGSSTIHYGTPVITVSTTAGPFTTYLVDVVAVQLIRDDGQVTEPLGLNANVGERIDFAKLTDRSELLGAPAVVEGTYTSASITVSYVGAQISVDLGGGTPQAATIVDTTNATPAAAVTYTVKFDPATPLVLKNGVSTPLDLNFDLSASTITTITAGTSGSTAQVAVRPFLSASTAPVYTKPMRARGVYVTTNDTASNFTMNTLPFTDTASNPFGALVVQTTDQTTYNVNGGLYTGAAGLAAIKTLQISTTVVAYGSLSTNLSSIAPTFNATQIYAGVSVENPLADTVTGTVVLRSGTTVIVRGATIISSRLGLLEYFNTDLSMIVSGSTLVSIDGQPAATGINQSSISIGQQISAAGVIDVDATTGAVTQFDATTGLVRLVATPVWGTLNAAATGSPASLNVLTLGGFEPAAFTFTGTGSTSATDSTAKTYMVNTGTLNLSAVALNTPLRLDGYVSAFGAAPPDFTATSFTPETAVEQELIVEWGTGGATAPFAVTPSSAGLVVDLKNAALGTVHVVQTGPTSIDLTNATDNPVGNPTIVPDGTPGLTNQFAIGNPASTTGLTVFNSFASFLPEITTTLNGTNSLQKLVAVGHWNVATGTFTAYRIDLVQVQ